MQNTTSYNVATINTNAISNENKLNALRTLVRLLDLDVVLLQEVESNQFSIPGFNTYTNVNETKRGTAIAVKQHMLVSNVQRSLDSRILTLKVNNCVTICNVYAPSGVQSYQSRESMFNQSLPFYLQNAGEYVLVGGDFNCVVSARDATGTNSQSIALRVLVQNMNLKDTWQIMNGTRTEFSFIRANSMSRLDRIYVSSNICSQVRTTSFHVNSFSDHKVYKTRVCLPDLGRAAGNGYWSMRTHTLTDENIIEFEHKWNWWTRQRRDYNSWMSWWLEYAKPRIKTFFKRKTNEAFRAFNAENEYLYAQLREAYDCLYLNPNALADVNHIKGRMLRLQRDFSSSYQRLNDPVVAGEHISSFQLGARMKRKKNSFISKITDGVQTQPLDAAEIEAHIHQYFQSLYSAGDVADPDGATTNRAIPSDSVPNAQVMEEITTEQLYNIIKTSASRKAPGNDGIPKEFYVRTFHVIHRQLNLVINEALNGNIPQKLVEGVVVLCHKKGGNNTIKSYRPLTMLNFDYKILSRILKTRIEEIMVRHDILTPSQKCSNGKRNIFEALLAVKDRIAQIKHTHIQGTLVSFDLDHAFDRVEHSYLFRVMDDMGFNRALIQLLRTIMDHSRSRVLVNGHLSPEFEIRRSVRQGDPMSMHLFVLHLHPLLEKIRTLCNDQLDLSTAYADDISVIVVDNTKLPTLKQLFFDFGRYSGAVLNLEKTVAMNIGRSSENLPWPSMETRVKILGINFFNDHKQMIQFNWDEVIRKTTQLMWMYKARNLTLIQKVTVLNMFVTSKLWFVASVLSIRNQDIARITRQLGFFLWGRQLRVPMEQICQPIAKGGLNLHLPMHKCRALLVNRFLCTIAETPFAEHLYGLVNNGGSLPATYPCLRPTWTTIRELPQQLRDNPCSSSIESHLLQALPTPKVVVNNPRASWRSVWRNVRARSLTSLEKSTFYLLVNGKLPHAALLFRQHRISSAFCIHCPNETEDLEHKLSKCRKISHLWNHLKPKLESILDRRVEFKNFQIPEFRAIRMANVERCLKLFINYVNFILDTKNDFTTQALDFLLNCNCP